MNPGLHEGLFQEFPSSRLKFSLSVFSRLKLSEKLLPCAIATQLGIRSKLLPGSGSSTISGWIKVRLPTWAPATAGRASRISSAHRPVLLNQEILTSQAHRGNSLVGIEVVSA